MGVFPLASNFFTAGKDLTDGTLAELMNTLNEDIEGLDSSVLGMNTGRMANVVVVEQLSDFPTPVSGVITLDTDTTYIANGFVDIGTNRIVAAAGSNIIGLAFARDGIYRSGSAIGAMITIPAAIGNFALVNVRLQTPNSGAYLVHAQGAGTNLFIADCDFEGDIGIIDGLTIMQVLNTSFVGYDSGLAVGNLVAFRVTSCSFRQKAGGTGVGLDFQGQATASFAAIATDFLAQTGAIAIRGLASNGNLPGDARGIINSCGFTGGGTAISGINADNLKWSIRNSPGVINSYAIGSCGMASNATPTTTSGQNWTKVLGTTVVDLERRFTHSTNRLTYTGLSPKLFRADVRLVARASSPGTAAEFGISVNGGAPAVGLPVELDNSKDTSFTFFTNSGDLETNDYLELWCRDSVGTASITVSDLYVVISPIAAGV